MKKYILSAVVLVAMLCSLVDCGSNTSTESDKPIDSERQIF